MSNMGEIYWWGWLWSTFSLWFWQSYINSTFTKNTQNSFTILIYLSDVTEEHGPIHFVPRHKSIKITEPKIFKVHKKVFKIN